MSASLIRDPYGGFFLAVFGHYIILHILLEAEEQGFIGLTIGAVVFSGIQAAMVILHRIIEFPLHPEYRGAGDGIVAGEGALLLGMTEGFQEVTVVLTLGTFLGELLDGRAAHAYGSGEDILILVFQEGKLHVVDGAEQRTFGNCASVPVVIVKLLEGTAHGTDEGIYVPVAGVVVSGAGVDPYLGAHHIVARYILCGDYGPGLMTCG